MRYINKARYHITTFRDSLDVRSTGYGVIAGGIAAIIGIILGAAIDGFM